MEESNTQQESIDENNAPEEVQEPPKIVIDEEYLKERYANKSLTGTDTL